MNKIYKVIWSKVKHQYVVTSEFAHSCTKSTTSRAGKSVVAALAAFVLTAGMGFSVQAVDPLDGDLNANKHNINDVNELHAMTVTATNGFVTSGVVQGNNIQGTTGNIGGVSFTGSKVTAAGGGTIGGVTIENGALSANGKTLDIEKAASAAENAEKALAAAEANTETLGEYEEAGIVPGDVADDATGSIAIGEGSAVESSHLNSAGAGSTGSVALGSGAKARNRNTTAIGSGAIAWGDKSTALGNNARTAKDAEQSVSIGYWAQANADNSVALGNFSVADEANTVSVGSGNMKRRVTNADDAIFGAGSSDLVTAGQLFKAGITPGYVADGVTGGISIGDPTNTRVEGNNAIAIGNGARATKDNAISIGAGSRAYATSGIALGISAQVYENATNSIALGDHSIADRKNTVSVGKVGAERQITNVAAGTAETDAVNVKQLSDATVGAGMVTWDPELDKNGDPIEGKYTDSIHGVGLQEGGKITGTSLVTNSTIAGEDYSVKIENGAVTTTGKAESSIGGVKFQSGKVTAENATVNTLLQVGASSNPNETTRIQGGTIHTGSVIGLTNTEWTGTTDNESRAATEGQLADLSETVAANAKGVVKWDDGTNDTIHGVQLAGDGAISAASDRFSVDRYGNIAAKTYGGQGDDTNYYFDMNHADGIKMGYSNGPSMNIDPYGVTFQYGDQKTIINGNTISTGRVNADTVQADAMYVGTQTPGNAVVTQDQLTGGISTATQGVVKWDPELDENGKPIEGKYTDSIHGVGLQEGGKITGTSLVTNSTIAGEDYSVKIENGAVTTTGKAESSIGGVKFQSGKVTAENATVNTLLQVGASSNPNETTRIQGGTIHTGSVIGLTNTEWTGTTDNESRAATEGQLADLSETVAANAKGVVKWDDGTNDTIHGVQLAGDGAISAASDRFSVDRYGNIAAKTYGGQGDDTNYYFDMNHADGIKMGYSNGPSMNIDPYGVTFQYGDQKTIINGNTINTGTLTADKVIADGMYIGSEKPENAVVTKGELDSAVTGATEGSVKWDQDGSGNYINSINGVGLEDGNVTADNVTTGTINAADGNFTVNENGNTSIGGSLDVAGDLVLKDGNGGSINVGDSITSIKDSIADVNGDISSVKEKVTQNTTDISGIKEQIGVNEDGSYKTIDNGAKDVITGINKNTAAIGDVSALKGTNANGEKYTNLTDAVNGNYDRIEQNTTAIAQNSQAINSLGHRVSDLGDEIDSVGAISAALAGLHPLDYDGTGSKFQISAAMGTYDGTQAAAIGGFYHFNRDVMLSLGGATSFEGDKKTAANIGVTFRVGEGASGKTVSNDILARLEAMDQKIAALEQENKELKNVLGAIDTSLSKEFPDVPANHWAYEAVTKLAGNDVVAGYPDGEFHGDR
ncbi:ESPR-type extended signal peptide-containing protein, partial [uncultured Megasphaera sp.]|uniref:ESPR-type extended signal peptide-containing protein n=1 Tax=uncultured Megasphaera sp. TaxID=165188 RepID=UPI00265D3E2F